MINEDRNRKLDLAVVVIVNLFNLMVLGLMLARVAQIDYNLAVPLVLMAVLLIVASIINIIAKREKWFFILPLILAVYLLGEWLLDYVFKIDFRSTWLLGPYLLLFYAGQMGMIGYAFLAKKSYGAVTLVTYFLSLAATAYSYAHVGHGV
jgi:hypothetical protein